MDQTNCSKEEAMDALIKNYGDIDNAIASLSNTSSVDLGITSKEVEIVMDQTNCAKEEGMDALVKQLKHIRGFKKGPGFPLAKN